jgi:hypothetical protein
MTETKYKGTFNVGADTTGQQKPSMKVLSTLELRTNMHRGLGYTPRPHAHSLYNARTRSI